MFSGQRPLIPAGIVHICSLQPAPPVRQHRDASNRPPSPSPRPIGPHSTPKTAPNAHRSDNKKKFSSTNQDNPPHLGTHHSEREGSFRACNYALQFLHPSPHSAPVSHQANDDGPWRSCGGIVTMACMLQPAPRRGQPQNLTHKTDPDVIARPLSGAAPPNESKNRQPRVRCPLHSSSVCSRQRANTRQASTMTNAAL